MNVEYLKGLIGLANLFIAIFILAYAAFFLFKTHKHRDRRPWELVLIAAVTYALFQLFNNLLVWEVVAIRGVETELISRIFEFLFSGLILLAVVVQHDLILRSHLILIMRKATAKGHKSCETEKK